MIIWLVGGLSHTASAQTIERRVDGGLVAGARQADIDMFRGIPYAAPPVGPLRWAEPQPVAPWRGTRPTTRYSPACTQMFGAERKLEQSEDCLYLNVFAPARRAARLLPVIVWFHGAGFNVGTASTDMFDGSLLSREGAVVVTVNYRLGILASLALPELTARSPHRTSGALIHLDQLAALRWVQRNISAFGGDPSRVLAFGQSSASIDMSVLQASPLAKGLFSRVMGASGAGLFGNGPWPAPDLGMAEATGLAWAKSKGTTSIDALRALPINRVMEDAPFSFPVGIDGYLLPALPGALFAAGRQNDLPTMAFFTSDEGFSAIAAATTTVAYDAALARVFGTYAPEVRALYPVSKDGDVKAVATRLANDAEFGRQMTEWATAQSRTGRSPAFLGTFAYGSWAPHGADVRYWFGTLDQPREDGTRLPVTASDRAMSARMRRMLVAFAANGDPSIAGQRFRPFGKNGVLLRLSSESAMEPVSLGVRWFMAHPDLVVGVGEPGFAGPGARH